MADPLRPAIKPLEILPTQNTLIDNTAIPTMVIRPSAGTEEAPTPKNVAQAPPAPVKPFDLSAVVNAAHLPVIGAETGDFDFSQVLNKGGLPVLGANPGRFVAKSPEAPTAQAAPKVNPLPVDNRDTAASFDALIQNMPGNVLNKVYQPTYHIRFFLAREGDIITQTQATDIGTLNQRMASVPQVVIAESGVTGFNIKQLDIETVTGSSARTLYMTPVQFTLVVTDPLGSSFLDSFQAAAQKLAISDFVKCSYYLQVQFKGYDESGRMVNPAQDFSNGGVWTYAVGINTIDAKLNESGGVYTLVMMPNDSQALMNFYNDGHHSPSMTPFQVSGDTLGDLWDDYVKKMNKARIDAQGVDKNTNLPILEIAIESAPIDKGPASAIGKNPRNFKLKSQEIGKDPQRADNMKTGKYSPVITSVSSIQEFILDSIKHTEEGQALTIDSMPAKPDTSAEALTGTGCKFREVVLFSVEVDPQVTGHDKDGTSQNYTRKVVYHVRSRSSLNTIFNKEQVENMKDPAVQRQVLQKLIANKYLNKRYDFIFTGLNTEVLEFNYDFNFAFQSLMPSFYGARQGSDSVSVNARQNPNNTKSDADRKSVDLEITVKTAPKNATVDNGGGVPVAPSQAATPGNLTKVSPADLVRASGVGGQAISAFGGASPLPALPQTALDQVQAAGVAGAFVRDQQTRPMATSSLSTSPMAAVNNSTPTATPKALAEVSPGGSPVYVEDLLAAQASQTSRQQDLPILIPFWPATQIAKNESGKDGFTGQFHRAQSVVGAVYAQEDPTVVPKFSEAKMTIRGDPFWMAQANLQRQVQLRSGQPEKFIDLPEWHGGGQLFYLHFRYPSAMGDDFKPVLKDSPIFGGLYTVNRVSSHFVDGTFKQELEAVRDLLLDPARITGSNNRNEGPASSPQMRQNASVPSVLQGLTAGQQTSTAVTPTALQAADTTAVGNLTAEQTAALKASIGFKESANNPSQGNNKLGFVGQYQTGAGFLSDQQYVTPAAAEAAKTDPNVLQRADSWTGKNGISSLGDYLANPSIQNDVMNRGMQNNYQTLVNNGVITADTTPNQTAGLLAAAHIAGATGASRFARSGTNPHDANGTDVASYYARGANSF